MESDSDLLTDDVYKYLVEGTYSSGLTANQKRTIRKPKNLQLETESFITRRFREERRYVLKRICT